MSPLRLSQVPFQTSPQLAGEGPARPLPSATLSGAREEAGGFVCANCIVRPKVLMLGCLIWGKVKHQSKRAAIHRGIIL